MGRVRQKNTEPELALRSELWRRGHRYTLDNSELPGAPDIANRSKRWAIFVHGCYWHRHPGCPKATIPKRNREFWLDKFAANVERDRRAISRLEDMGFAVRVVWGCELSDDDAVARSVDGLRLPE